MTPAQSVVIATSILIVYTFQCRHCQREVSGIGPTDIIRSDGETNVFIPCPFPGPNAPTWKINDVYYDMSSLPTEYVPASSGLLLPRIQKSMDQTTFQCFVPAGDSAKNYRLQSSSTGTLKVDEIIPVHERLKYYNFVEQTHPLPTFELDHQYLDFNANFKVLAWTTSPDIESTCNLFKLKSTNCSSDIGIRNWYERGSASNTITLYDNELWDVTTSEYYYFKFIANSSLSGTECQEIKPYLVFEPLASTKELRAAQEGFCINIATANPSIALPRDANRTRNRRDDTDSQDSKLKDCTCSIFTATESDCNDLVKCSCASETIFNETIKACRRSNKLCFTNLSVQMNNTLIFIFDTYTECHPEINKLYRRYNNISFKIMIVLPNPPSNIVVDDQKGELYFTSSLNNPEEISLDFYQVVITDRTKNEIFSQPEIISEQSYNISVNVGDIFNNTNCSPYNVTVQAINKFGSSEAFKVIDHDLNRISPGNRCACLKSNVIISPEPYPIELVNNDHGTLVIDMNCNQTHYKSDVLLKVSLEHQNTIVNRTHACSNDKPIYFRSVKCGKTYRLMVHWLLPGQENQDGICHLYENSTVTLPCSGSDSSDTIIVGTVVGGFAFILLVIIVIYVLCKAIKKIRRSTHQSEQLGQD